MARLIGEVDLSSVPLTMNKSDFARDGSEWVALEQRMHTLLAPIAKRLALDEMAPPPASTLKTAELVRRLLGQALKLAEREELFPGLAASRSHAEAAAPVSQHRVGKPDVPRAPARPPDKDSPRRRGLGQVVVRPLDSTIRSQTVIEDDVSTIVINSVHPLFLKRSGDMWYQLETAIREVFRTLEGATVPDYERRVNEVVLLAFKLRARRKSLRTRKTPGQLELIQ